MLTRTKRAMIFVAIGCAVSSGCTRTVTEYEVIDTSCYSFRPIILEEEDVDVISDSLVTQLRAHNRTGARLCSWRN